MTDTELPAELLAKLQQRYTQLIEDGMATNTRLAYQRDLKSFWSWTHHTLGLAEHYPIDLTTIITYIIERTTSSDKPLKVSTLRRYLASISVAHQECGLDSPTHTPSVKLLLRRIQNTQAQQQGHRKAAITADLLQLMIDTCDDSLIGIRDKAILLVGFASGGRRRSELVHLQAQDLVKIDAG